MDKKITELLWGILTVLALDFETTHGDDENIDNTTKNLIEYIVRNLVLTEASRQTVMDAINTDDGGDNSSNDEYPTE